MSSPLRSIECTCRGGRKAAARMQSNKPWCVREEKKKKKKKRTINMPTASHPYAEDVRTILQHSGAYSYRSDVWIDIDPQMRHQMRHHPRPRRHRPRGRASTTTTTTFALPDPAGPSPWPAVTEKRAQHRGELGAPRGLG